MIFLGVFERFEDVRLRGLRVQPGVERFDLRAAL